MQNRIKYFVEKHPNLFTYLPPKDVHPHDHLMAWTVLRLFPKSVTPNKVTAFRIITTPIVFLLILFGFYKIGIIAFVLVAFTDAIDGSMARTRNKVTNFGTMLDPLADKFLIGSMVILLVFKYFNVWLGVAILGIEIIIIFVGAFKVKYQFKTIRMANLWGKTKMILQVLAVFLTLAALLLDFPYLFTLAAWVFGLAIGFAIVSLFAYGI